MLKQMKNSEDLTKIKAKMMDHTMIRGMANVITGILMVLMLIPIQFVGVKIALALLLIFEAAYAYDTDSKIYTDHGEPYDKDGEAMMLLSGSGVISAVVAFIWLVARTLIVCAL